MMHHPHGDITVGVNGGKNRQIMIESVVENFTEQVASSDR